MDRAKRKKAKRNIPFRFIFDELSLRSEGKDAYVGLWTERVRWTRGEDWEWGHRSIEIVSWATSKLYGGQLHVVITLHSSSVDSHWLSLFPQSVKRTKIFQHLQWKTLINIELFSRSLLFTIWKIFKMIRSFEQKIISRSIKNWFLVFIGCQIVCFFFLFIFRKPYRILLSIRNTYMYR